jgi:hypothetical protein
MIRGGVEFMKSIIVFVLFFSFLIPGSAYRGENNSEMDVAVEEDFGTARNYSYDEIDAHALAAPKSSEESVQSLAAYLIEPAANDREKARAIFRWICENIDYDLEAYFTGRIGSTNSTDVLKSRSSVCSGYSDLFSSLAGEAGLETVKIRGYGKGYSYRPGDNFTGPYNHAWNAVKINGTWYLVDATWGAGYLGNAGYVRLFDDHYFLTQPSQFIFDHLPDEERWQLLDEPLSKAEFERLVYVESDFFNLELRLGERNGTLATEGEVNVSVYAPEDVVMMASLESESEVLEGRTFCQRDKDRYDIRARFPEAGRYILKAYAKRKDDPGVYNSVMQYNINASSAGAGGFPMTFSRFGEVGAYLYSPLDGSLKAGESRHFKIRVPGAAEVAIVCGKEWTKLAAEGDLFEGNVTVAGGDAGVFANFGGEKWEGMVRYVGE